MTLKGILYNLNTFLRSPKKWRKHWQRRGLYKQVTLIAQKRTCCKVISGPFQGMSYVPTSTGSSYVPKLLGTYESELHSSIESLLSSRVYSCAVNIGCAEGYYAVGLALRLKGIPILACDTSPHALSLCKKLAAINNAIDQITTCGKVTALGLSDILSPNGLIVCDCEGAEMQILDPAQAPVVQTCDIIVETHDHIVTDSKETLIRRFSGSHEVTEIKSTNRDINSAAAFLGVDKQLAAIAVDEGRPVSMSWLILRAKSRA